MKESLEDARNKWKYRGVHRPPFAIEPSEGQESVWDYPRPPAIQPDPRYVEVTLHGQRIASSRESVRVLETAGPPVFYLPPEHVDRDLLRSTRENSTCEWKGIATYFDVVGTHGSVKLAAWTYPTPFGNYQPLAGFVSFYPSKVNCRVDGERVRAQHGNVYGGWVTDEIVGPWKGLPGTSDW